MPQILFTIDQSSIFAGNQDGMINLQPTLNNHGRLYVIWSANHPRPVYVGKSRHVQNRFNGRVQALNHVGVTDQSLENNFVFTIRITINGHYSQVGDDGLAGGINVEHLLIRIYINYYQFLLRNVDLWNLPFNNGDHNGLYVRYIDPNNRVNGFAPIDNAGNFVQLLAGVGNY
ncbi:hypothetical protein [Okeania sp. SIO2B3]|uniref:hypothetical protein n=1 Tax=Okeania sp. SIO2B3 TaxID=2607784 RepID=UPI0013C08416|nr:hypothetical protein [Okeania sp. SIO2B3]NET42134.1 hypothetical protein [Okeania sp. SIO2B3]